MDALEVILTRHSTRTFVKAKLEPEILETLLNAAMSAPSAANSQPWQFVVLDDHAIMDEIPKFHPYAAMIVDAAVAILVCGDTTLEKFTGRWMLDCSNASENMLLAAHALGLGAVWVGFYPDPNREQGIRALINLPDTVHPVSLLVVGVPAAPIEYKPHTRRYKPERIHKNGW